MASELLRQVRVLDPISNTDQVADVLIVDGWIRSVADRITDIPEQTQVFDRPGLVLGPGLVDLYSHSGEPGHETRETLESLLQAARAGGFTRLTLLPDTEPPTDNPAGVEWLHARNQELASLGVQLQIWGALTLGLQGQQMSELGDLHAAGVVGFADGTPLSNTALLRRLLEYVQPLGKPMALWCCDRQLAGNGVVREGAESIRLGLPGSPAIAESAPLAALLECIAAIRTSVHLMRISTARSVELIQAAKATGLPITASTSWMHLLLDSTALQRYDPSLRVEPPLGNSDDQAALIEAIRSGVLDAIAIDHAPYTYEEKTVAFAEAPAGAIGLELALPLLWQALVVSGQCPALNLWCCLSTNPAQCLGDMLHPIQPDYPAELTLFDPQQVWKVTPIALKSRSSNTPWLGQEITGRVLKTWGGSTKT